MRQRRAKAYKKLMSLYQLSFGFREPYQILVHSDICSASASFKLDLVKQFSNVMQGNVKPMITQCCIVELYKLGPSEQQSVDLAKSFERRKCNHREAIPGEDCLINVVGDTNKHRYIVACQSQTIRTRLRDVAGVPIVHLNRSVVVLEPPSEATLGVKRAVEQEALLPSVPERSQLTESVELPQMKKRKGPKGPNPLSVKKKKVKLTKEIPTNAGAKRKREDEDSSKPKRKRRRKSHSNLQERE